MRFISERLARHRQFLVFLTGGGLSALIDVGLMQGLIFVGVGYPIAVSVGFFTGLLFNYLFHSTLTFRETPTAGSLVRYLILVGFNYLFTLACVGLAVHWGRQPIVGKMISLPIIAVDGFLIGKYWIFRKTNQSFH